MKLQIVVVVILLVAGAIFTVLNQDTVVEKLAVQLPWGVVERAVVQDLLTISTAALLLLCLRGSIRGCRQEPTGSLETCLRNVSRRS